MPVRELVSSSAISKSNRSFEIGICALLMVAAGIGAVCIGWGAASGSSALVVIGLLLIAASAIHAWIIRRDYLALVSRLERSAARVGDDGFIRPVASGPFAHLDGIAAALATRHGTLLGALEKNDGANRSLLALLEASPGPALLVDEQGTVLMANGVLSQRFQIGTHEAVGRPFLHVVRDHHIDDTLKECLERGLSETFETDVYSSKPPGRFRVFLQPIMSEDLIIEGAAVLLIDVTRLYHLERVRSEFVANVSHELRTPVTSIKGFVETLLDEELPDETRRRFLGILKGEADRLDALLTDLLNLSLLEWDKQPLRREDVNLGDMARRVVDMLEIQAASKDISVEIAVPDDLPPVPLNPDMFEQAIVNLLDNAIKYTPEGGQIHIDARRIAAGHVELSVADNGPGIPSEDLPRIFERFYRADKARTRSYGGTGLGLAIVRHIVQRHGGSVRAESRLGKGSRFIVTLPLDAEEPPSPQWTDRNGRSL